VLLDTKLYVYQQSSHGRSCHGLITLLLEAWVTAEKACRSVFLHGCTKQPGLVGVKSSPHDTENRFSAQANFHPHAACTTLTGLLLASVDLPELPVGYKMTAAHLCWCAQSHKVLPSVHLPGGGTDGAFSALLSQRETDAGDGLQPHDSLQPCLAESDPTAVPALACSSLHAYAHTSVRGHAGVSQSVQVKHKTQSNLEQ